MNAKKSTKANLEKKRIIFSQIGMVITLALVLLAFEWKTYDYSGSSFRSEGADLTPEELVLNTIQKPPPPPPPMQIPTTVLNIVDNGDEIKIDVEIDVEADGKTEIKPYIPTYKDEDSDTTPGDELFISVQHMPEFPGGEEGRIRYLEDNINYPLIAKETDIHGNVYVTFIVETDGSITNVQILKGIGGGCDEEAMRIVENMPDWSPGTQRGMPVRVKLNMHIRFTLL